MFLQDDIDASRAACGEYPGLRIRPGIRGYGYYRALPQGASIDSEYESWLLLHSAEVGTPQEDTASSVEGVLRREVPNQLRLEIECHLP